MRETLRYIENTAKKVVGIGAFQRIRMHEIYLYHTGKVDRIIFSTAYSLAEIMAPAAFKTVSKRYGEQKLPIAAGTLDLIIDVSSLLMVGEGLYWEGGAVKLGYNTLVQIAPDVASLAKRKIFHRI